MNTTSAPLFSENTEQDIDTTRTFINPTLWFVDSDGYRVVFCRQEILYRVALDDSPQMSLVAVMLRQSQLATQIEIAAAFGHSVASQRRWEKRYSLFGSAGLIPKTQSGRPAKLGRGQSAFVKRWIHQGVSNQEMARRLGVGETTIRRVLLQAGLRRRTPSQPELPSMDSVSAPVHPVTAVEPAVVVVPAPVSVPEAGEPVVELPLEATPANADGTIPPPCSEAIPLPATLVLADQVTTSGFSLDTDPADRSGDRALACLGLLGDAVPLFGDHEELPRAGVLMAVPVLQAHGGLGIFSRLYGSVLGPAFYGLRTTVLSLVLMALLRIKRPENLKEYS